MMPFGLRDALDILIMALLLFYLYKIMRESGTINIFFGVLAFIVVWVFASQILEMKLIGTVLDKFMSIGLLVLVILFQDQIKGLRSAAPIKTREYCSRGLPFVYGYEDDGFTGKEPYVRQVTNSPKPVDMNEIIELYEATAQNRDVIAEMRNYAEKNFSWDVLLKDVVEYMKNEGR